MDAIMAVITGVITVLAITPAVFVLLSKFVNLMICFQIQRVNLNQVLKIPSMFIEKMRNII